MGGEECFEIKLLPQERYANAELWLASLGLGLGVAFFKGFKKNCENALIWVSDGVASRSGLNFKGKYQKSPQPLTLFANSSSIIFWTIVPEISFPHPNLLILSFFFVGQHNRHLYQK